MDTITELNVAPSRNSGGTQEDLAVLHDLAQAHPQIELAHVSTSFITLRGPGEILRALVGPFEPKLLVEENKSLPPIDNGPFMGGFSPTISGGGTSDNSGIEVIEDTPENDTDEEGISPESSNTNGTTRLH